MLRSYRDAVCLVTGGASGIGEALSRELARRGAHVILADRQQERAAAVAKEIESTGGRARAAVLDVRDGYVAYSHKRIPRDAFETNVVSQYRAVGQRMVRLHTAIDVFPEDVVERHVSVEMMARTR